MQIQERKIKMNKTNKTVSTIKTCVIVVLVIIILINLSSTRAYKAGMNKLLREKDMKIAELRILLDEERYGDETETYTDDYTESSYKEETPAYLTSVSLSDGSYSVPRDIKAGTYNIKSEDGDFGLITGDLASGYISTTIGKREGHKENTYNNLRLSNGDEFKIEGGCTMVFEPVK